MHATMHEWQVENYSEEAYNWIGNLNQMSIPQQNIYGIGFYQTDQANQDL